MMHFWFFKVIGVSHIIYPYYELCKRTVGEGKPEQGEEEKRGGEGEEEKRGGGRRGQS